MSCGYKAAILTLLLIATGQALPARAAESFTPGRISFDALKGHSIVIPETQDGRMKIRFGKDGAATVTTDAFPEFSAMWWVNPVGQICLVSDVVWNGGRCYRPLKDATNRLAAVQEAAGGPILPITVK